MNTMENELKQLIIDTLELEDISVADIDSHAPLFNDGLGLDSIDALELGLAIRKKYDVKIDAEKEDAVKIFSSVSTLAEYIQAARG
ncbi:phosphopantetheine-binding protein [Methylobacter sp. Wu8]|nr:phosphopantetheine-binding protein [Methylobacter tundripaludum]MCF7964732.1 acyl carrier protein [Methylobacter tundripaludum]MCK9636434.1 phosphopantetheine-binding protein [Methylobacter tundripaludum]